MNLATLKQSPDGTKMVLQAQVTDAGQMAPGQYGPWGKIKLCDASGEHEVTYSCGEKNPFYVQLDHVYEFQLSLKFNGEYRNLRCYVKNQAGQAAAAPPPAQTPADTNQYQNPPGYNPPQMTPQVATEIIAQQQQPIAPAQTQFSLSDDKKSTCANCAGMIVERLMIAGVIQPNTNPGNTLEDNINEWANYLYNAAKGLGKSDDMFQGQISRNMAGGLAADGYNPASDEIPY